MEKKILRLTESELGKMIRESVDNVLSELDWRTYANASQKAYSLADSLVKPYEKMRRQKQGEKLFRKSKEAREKQYGLDKIKQREKQHYYDKLNGLRFDEYEPTSGELKRLQRHSDDVEDFEHGNAKYADGKWNRIRENKLKKVVRESINNVLSELDWRTYASAAKKNDKWREENPRHRANQWNRSYDFRHAARDAFDKKHGLEHQYDDVERGYSPKGTIDLDTHDFSIRGSRDHDFGDENPHGLNHNVYHMSKKYGKDGNYGRTRMWDFAHETTPEEFYGDEKLGKKFRDAEKEVEDFNSGKTTYEKNKGWD